MSDDRDFTVLVPVAVLEGESVPAALVETLSSVSVVVLGYHVIPDQTATDQARMQFEDRAQTKLAALRAAFEEAGGDVVTRLVFTHDASQTFERVSVEESVDAVLLLNPAPAMDRVFVPIREDINLERIADAVAALVAGTTLDVTLYHATESDGGRESGDVLLSTLEGELVERGVERANIEKLVAVTETPVGDIADRAVEYDMVVVGESKPTVLDAIFGEPSERLAEESLTPTLVIRGLVDDDGDEFERERGESTDGAESTGEADGD